MLQSLEIENFRQFSHFTIPKLGRINLLTGKNNSGKTSVLEAIHLLMTQEHPAQVMIKLQISRGEVSPIPDSDQYAAEITHLFCNRQVSEGEVIKISGANEQAKERRLTIQIDSNRNPKKSTIIVDDFSKDFYKVNWPKLILERQNWNSEIHKYEGIILPDIRIAFNRSADFQDSFAQDQESHFLVSTNLNSREVTSLFDEIVLRPEEDRVIEAIKIIEPNIKRIAPDHTQVEKVGLSPRQGFLTQILGGNGRTPMGSMGDGIWRLLGIVLTMVNAKGKVLLIDEIDTGFHYSVMVDLWKLIWKTAQELDIQIFATTHSQDCWKSLAGLIYEEGEKATENGGIIIHHIDSSKDEPTSIFDDEIIDAVKNRIELR